MVHDVSVNFIMYKRHLVHVQTVDIDILSCLNERHQL